MKTNILYKSLAALVISGALLWAGYYLLVRPSLQHAPVTAAPDALFGWKFPVTKLPETGSPLYSEIRAPGGVPQGLPVRLQIPSIRVNSAIEDALITADGRMDVPAGTVDVAWFSLGPHPGQIGSAVIGGHYGIRNGIPFVFYNLDKLQVGDMIYIIDDNDNTIAFVIRSIKSFDRDADATTVFTSTDGLAHLNLITCEGIWNEVNGNYPKRLVLFTDQVPSSGVAPATSLSAAAFPRSLSIGATGPDVSALQTALQQKGFLVMPPKIATGYFGSLTRVAVVKFQTSVGLPPVGNFGPLTRDKLITSLAVNSILPYLGTEGTATSGGIVTMSSLLQTLAFVIGSLFATLTDGLITSILLLAILALTYVIIRRR